MLTHPEWLAILLDREATYRDDKRLLARLLCQAEAGQASRGPLAPLALVTCSCWPNGIGVSRHDGRHRYHRRIDKRGAHLQVLDQVLDKVHLDPTDATRRRLHCLLSALAEASGNASSRQPSPSESLKPPSSSTPRGGQFFMAPDNWNNGLPPTAMALPPIAAPHAADTCNLDPNRSDPVWLRLRTTCKGPMVEDPQAGGRSNHVVGAKLTVNGAHRAARRS